MGALDQTRAAIAPTQRFAVMDLVAQAGIDVSSWTRKRDGTPVKDPRANPAYCYEWAFGSDAEGYVLCIWHEALKEFSLPQGAAIGFSENVRQLKLSLDRKAIDRAQPSDVRNRSRDQAKRAQKFESALQRSFRMGKLVRVIINEGDRREEDELGTSRSTVRLRRLDDKNWFVHRYDDETGEALLVRGIDPVQPVADVGDMPPSLAESSQSEVTTPGAAAPVLDRSGVASGAKQASAPVVAYPFRVGDSYTRRNVFQTIGIPEPTGGPWFTGYASHGPDWFVFCGIGTGGRTGHDYGNHFDGERLVWYAKGPSELSHTSIKSLLHPAGRVYLFYRESDRDPFTYAGLAVAHEVFDESPVKVVWKFEDPQGGVPVGSLPEEIDGDESTVQEGARRTIEVNAYERDPNARRKCIAHWGTSCVVCEFDFLRKYGEIGRDFIHVHHLRPLGEVGEEYDLDPIADLRPVCPNCHAMLHRRRPVLTIEELRFELAALGQR